MIAKFLDLSTAYITKKDAKILEAMASGEPVSKGYPFPRIINHEYGWFVNVQLEAEIFTDYLLGCCDAGMSKPFLRLFKHAKNCECVWINLDQDGPRDLKGFRTFTW